MVERESTQPTWKPDIALDAAEDVPTGRIQRMWLIGGRYELDGLISQGGMGRVYRGVHRDLNRAFALKLVHDTLRWEVEFRERFFMEARLASSLQHPNIISVTDFGLDEHQGYYLVMELLSGETLRARVGKARPTSVEALDIINQLAGALDYIHDRGIIHCDLKPENVFLSRVEASRRRNMVKLLDFGLSWRSGTPAEASLAGTPPYLAPERLRGEPPSPASDVYSLGAIFYELLTGRAPYTGKVLDMMEQQLRGPIPPPPSALTGAPIDARIERLVMRALDREPEVRFPSARALREELSAIMGEQGMRLRAGPGESTTDDPHLLAREGARFAARALQAIDAGDLNTVKQVLRDALDRFAKAR
jgi:serine/threonine-protein kinase